MLWHRQAIFESKGNKLSSSAECRIRTQRVSETQSPADRMPADKPTELSRIKLKKIWTRQPVPMISKHSAHLTPLRFGIRTWLWRYTYLLLLISMLWHRQAIFELKGDKLSSSAECRIRTQRVSETQSPADWMPGDKPTELSRIKLKKNFNSTARPYDQQAFSPPDSTAIWHSHMALAIYIFVVNFDALAQASGFRIKRDELSSSAECRIRSQRVSETQSPADWMPADKPTELSRIKLKNLNSTTRPYDQQEFSPPDPTASHAVIRTYHVIYHNG